jgi:hypothetical protein
MRAVSLSGGFAEWDRRRAERWFFWLGPAAEDVSINLSSDMRAARSACLVVFPQRYLEILRAQARGVARRADAPDQAA